MFKIQIKLLHAIILGTSQTMMSKEQHHNNLGHYIRGIPNMQSNQNRTINFLGEG